MGNYPFLHVFEATLTANGTGTLSVIVPNSEKLTIHSIFFTSTGVFNITDIRTSDGVHYTNASASVEIPSSIMGSVADGYNTIVDLAGEIVVDGGTTFYIDLEDSSGSGNTVTFVLNSLKETP